MVDPSQRAVADLHFLSNIILIIILFKVTILLTEETKISIQLDHRMEESICSS